VRDATERDSAVAHPAVGADVEQGGHGHQRERERRALTDLAVRLPGWCLIGARWRR
jgi:hypothetical protein